MNSKQRRKSERHWKYRYSRKLKELIPVSDEYDIVGMRNTVYEWLLTTYGSNVENRNWSMNHQGHDYYMFLFHKEEDALQFALKWL